MKGAKHNAMCTVTNLLIFPASLSGKLKELGAVRAAQFTPDAHFIIHQDLFAMHGEETYKLSILDVPAISSR